MITAIFVAPDHGQPQQQVTEVEVVAGSGIVGDRNFGQARWPGQNLTLIEAESIDAYNEQQGQQIALAATRRNLVTRGVALNPLVGKTFRIGAVQLYGVELCEPCAVLGRLLAHEGWSQKDVVSAWVHQAGLRVDVLSSGVLAVGMAFSL